MFLNSVFVGAFVAGLLVCLIEALDPAKRRRALHNAGLIVVMGLLLLFFELHKLLPNVPIQIWRILQVSLITVLVLSFCIRDLWAGIPWRQAMYRNRGVLALTVIASLMLVFGLVA